MEKGTLYLVPVALAENASAQSYTAFHRETINHIRTYIVENEKTARKFLKEGGLERPQSELLIHDYGKHKRNTSVGAFFKELMQGEDVALMSEAGCPGIADPGADIVAEAHGRGIRVRPLVGPSSILLALMASGFSGQSFTFNGYLPIDKAERAKRIKSLEQLALTRKQTQIFIETPFRNNPLIEELLRTCAPGTRLCIAANITGPDEMIKTLPISLWRKEKPDLHKQPTVFMIF